MVRRKVRRRVTRRRTTRRRKSAITFKLKESTTHEIGAIIYGCLAIISLMSIQGAAGPMGNSFREYMLSGFGRGIWLFPICLGIMSASLFFSRKVNIHFTKLCGIILAFFSFLGLIHLGTPINDQLTNIESFGGYTGFTTAYMLRLLWGETGTTIILTGLLLIGILIIFEISLSEMIRLLNPMRLIEFKIDKSGIKTKKNKIKIIKPELKKEPDQTFAIKSIKKENSIEPSIKKVIKIPEQSKIEQETNISVKKKINYKKWDYPSLTLLENSNSKVKIDEKELYSNANKVKEKLSQFGINVSMHDVNVGPTVTQYTLKPHEGVKLNKITALKNDMALTLAAKSIRIQAPIPGKALVGIEMPNSNRMIVHLREIMESPEFKKLKSKLSLPFGRDVSGKPFALSLEDMPHLLIAGRTGSGKSVCMNCFLLSLLFQNSPHELKFIMIDPKRVELMPFSGIPHLLTSVITDIDKAISSLRWAVAEMSRRYTELSKKRYRNIHEYNEHESEKMSKIVIVIDELADLMMRNNRKEAELLICRLAQMARAVGIHLIIATQRPSVDVITGLIKANIPMRIAFAVSSGIDSRTILDSTGAEDLLGLGDMLIETNSDSGLVRIQGILVSRKEIEKVTNKIKLTIDPDYNEQIKLDTDFENNDKMTNVSLPGMGENLTLDGSEDPKFLEALEIVKKTGKASATLLQRYLSIGYARAAKILDYMEQKNMIGPSNGAKARKIYFLENNATPTTQENNIEHSIAA